MAEEKRQQELRERQQRQQEQQERRREQQQRRQEAAEEDADEEEVRWRTSGRGQTVASARVGGSGGIPITVRSAPPPTTDCCSVSVYR